MKKDDLLLDVNDLSVSFRLYDSMLEQYDLQVISNLSLNVKPGEIVAIAGSSGSGKSLLAHAVMGLLPPNSACSGNMFYKGERLTKENQKKLRGSDIALVPQSVNFLDPLMRVGTQVRKGEKSQKAMNDQKKAFERFQLEERVEKLYPFELSGGMARRILVSTAIVSDADLIIADEPTPGLDVEIALEALQCFKEFADQGKGIVLITHDIDLAFNIADRIAVFYAGTTLEVAEAKDFREGPDVLRHPYSKALWNALPQNGFKPIPGFQPYARDLPKGCLFGPRCPYYTKECGEPGIPMRTLRDGLVRCVHAT